MVLSGYVRGKGYSFPRHPSINGLCNSRLCRPRLRPLRLRPSCLGARRACALCVSQATFSLSRFHFNTEDTVSFTGKVFISFTAAATVRENALP